MPMGTKQEQREYQRRWIALRRSAWFAGKCCVWCGSVQKLELDHIDPALKVHHRVWSWSEVRRAAELAKCRPLCGVCHKARSVAQLRKPIVHGTIVGYMNHGCRCDPCRLANSTYRAKRRIKSKRRPL